jgi:hypothetical protein
MRKNCLETNTAQRPRARHAITHTRYHIRCAEQNHVRLTQCFNNWHFATTHSKRTGKAVTFRFVLSGLQHSAHAIRYGAVIISTVRTTKHETTRPLEVTAVRKTHDLGNPPQLCFLKP